MLIGRRLALTLAPGAGGFYVTPLRALAAAGAVVLVPCGCVVSSPHLRLTFSALSQSRQICPQDRRGCPLDTLFFWLGDD